MNLLVFSELRLLVDVSQTPSKSDLISHRFRLAIPVHLGHHYFCAFSFHQMETWLQRKNSIHDCGEKFSHRGQLQMRFSSGWKIIPRNMKRIRFRPGYIWLSDEGKIRWDVVWTLHIWNISAICLDLGCLGKLNFEVNDYVISKLVCNDFA